MTKKLPPGVKNLRKPTRVACTFCSQKHLQCDDSRPCKNCTKRGFADSCKDAIRKKKKTTVTAGAGSVRKKQVVPDKPPKPRGRPRKVRPSEKPPLVAELPLIESKDHQLSKSSKDLKSMSSFSNLNTAGLSAFNLPNLTSLSSFLNTPKSNSFAQLPQSPLPSQQQQVQQQQVPPQQQPQQQLQQQQLQQLQQLQQKQQNTQSHMAQMPSFSDIKLSSSFWDIKGSAGDSPSNQTNLNSTSALVKSSNQLFTGLASNPQTSNNNQLTQTKSTTNLMNILNPPAVSSERKIDSTSEEDDEHEEGPLEFKANISYTNNKSPSRSSVSHSKTTATVDELNASESLIQLNELLSNGTPNSNGTPYKKSTASSITNGGNNNNNFNAGYAQQMNFEMDGLKYPNSSILTNLDDEDSRPFIEINLEDGSMVSSYTNNGTPNSFVFNPNHSQMPNTASEIPNDIEQNDDYTSPLIMRHVIKHPDDIYLTSIVKSYQYPNAYHALIAYLKRRFNKLQLLEIAKCMAKYRPSFISATKSLYENDLIFTERSFQRTLLEYEHLISMSPSPTIIWRRTGEIVAMTNAFCVMTGYSKMSLLSKRTYIVELMDDESTIKYFRSFSDLAFGDLNANYLTDCNLRKANDDDYLKCCCIWTIKRDAFDIPMLIVGQFLPVLE